jgi:DNA-binding response OmpR family regulator
MSRGRILIADDEPTFLTSTAELLRREGFTVETATDGDAAVAAMVAARTEGPFDLLITDLEMPGNADLDLVRQVAHLSGGLPIIIITGFPSVRSAIASIELPVAAYLVKPVHFPDLLTRVSSAVARFRSYRAMQHAESRLLADREDMATAGSAATLAAPATSPPSGSEIDQFLGLTLRNVMGSLTDLEHLGRALAGQSRDTEHACQLINCPRGGQLRSAIEETIGVLEATRASFKSKALGDLRHRLELLLRHG